MMIKKFLVLLFAFSTLIQASEVYVVDGVYIDSDTGYYTGYYDYDKVWDEVDEYYCWAYSAANMLQYWQDKQSDSYIYLNSIPDGASTGTYEGEIIATFLDVSWYDYGGYEYDAFTWWLTDTTGVYQSDDLSTSLFPDGGGYWSDYFEDSSSIYTMTAMYGEEYDLFINLLGEAIDSDSPAVLSIQCFDEDGELKYGHTLTVWGYATDDEGNYWLYFTDSDDLVQGMFALNIDYDDEDGTWYLQGYDATNDWAIARITTLDVGVLSLTVPEPGTVTLSLLALAGLCMHRRRKVD